MKMVESLTKSMPLDLKDQLKSLNKNVGSVKSSLKKVGEEVHGRLDKFEESIWFIRKLTEQLN